MTNFLSRDRMKLYGLNRDFASLHEIDLFVKHEVYNCVLISRLKNAFKVHNITLAFFIW